MSVSKYWYHKAKRRKRKITRGLHREAGIILTLTTISLAAWHLKFRQSQEIAPASALLFPASTSPRTKNRNRSLRTAVAISADLHTTLALGESPLTTYARIGPAERRRHKSRFMAAYTPPSLPTSLRLDLAAVCILTSVGRGGEGTNGVVGTGTKSLGRGCAIRRMCIDMRLPVALGLLVTRWGLFSWRGDVTITFYESVAYGKAANTQKSCRKDQTQERSSFYMMKYSVIESST